MIGRKNKTLFVISSAKNPNRRVPRSSFPLADLRIGQDELQQICGDQDPGSTHTDMRLIHISHLRLETHVKRARVWLEPNITTLLLHSATDPRLSPRAPTAMATMALFVEVEHQQLV